MATIPAPFHEYAEEIGNYLAEDRAREAALRARQENTFPVNSPTESAD